MVQFHLGSEYSCSDQFVQLFTVICRGQILIYDMGNNVLLGLSNEVLIHVLGRYDLQFIIVMVENKSKNLWGFFSDSVGENPQSVTEYPELPKLQLKTAAERMPTTQCMYTSIQCCKLVQVCP